MVNLIVNGAAGRMGRTLVRLINESNTLHLVGAVDTLSSPDIGEDAGELAEIGNIGVKLSGRLAEVAALGDVIIDFSSADSTMDVLEIAQGARKAVIVGTTGHSVDQKILFRKFYNDIPVLMSPNMSVGVNLLWKLTEIAAKTLNSEYRIGISETHHVHKVDSPSGTAKRMVEIVSKYAKKPDSVEAFREGEVVGDHSVFFENGEEKIELFHHAKTRDIFAAGALKAAEWIVDKGPGIYDMGDVLF